jgi:diaminohydroxyphosphoribosylaminopyrimidine deaminase/5-amino-6-(5-phosphoribosylamino)uracil reductase
VNDLHEAFMRKALVLAAKGIGRTAPNPAVGCVIVRDGVIVGEGWHRKAGTPHAEVHALLAAGERAPGADAYVTLEPCSHVGRTPPCADALIQARVARVFVGMVDPNPLVSGSGIDKLREAGIQVECGILESRCRDINRPFIKHVTTGLPFVTLKSALTLDGKTATCSGDSKWVSSDISRKYVHRLRSLVDAVMVGVGTVVADDPLLTSRIRGGRDPLRVIVDSSLRIPPASRVLSVASKASTIIATTPGSAAEGAPVSQWGAELLECKDSAGKVDLHDLLRRLGRRGVQSVMLEGGALLAAAFLRERLIDRCLFFYAPKVLGSDGIGLFSGPGTMRMEDAIPLVNLRVRRVGGDILVEGEPRYTCLPD